jgi:CDP-diacylglycerol--serine O-phosphatidyltransferase
MSNIFPPFDPDDMPRHRRVRQLSQIPIRLILPNLVTLLALCAGLTFVNFGVAPAILLFVWALAELRSLGWIAALLFAICAALRLARFNVALDNPNKPEWQTNFFVGMPAPAGAMTVMLPIYMEFIGTPHGGWTAPVVGVYTLGIGLLMVSRVPTWSGKLVGKRIPRDAVLPTFVLVVLAAAFLVSFPWETMTVLTFAYLGCLPLSWNSWQRHLKAQNGRAEKVVGARATDSDRE